MGKKTSEKVKLEVSHKILTGNQVRKLDIEEREEYISSLKLALYRAIEEKKLELKTKSDFKNGIRVNFELILLACMKTNILFLATEPIEEALKEINMVENDYNGFIPIQRRSKTGFVGFVVEGEFKIEKPKAK